MKKENPSDIELIERYFDGEASAEEITLFGQKQSLEPSFRDQIKHHQNLLEAIRESKRNELRQMLADLDETMPPVPLPPFKWGKILFAFLIVLAIFGGASWWYFKDPTPAETPSQSTLIAQYFPPESVDGARRGVDPERDKFLNCLQANEYGCAVSAYQQLPEKEKGFEENQLDYAYSLVQVGKSEDAVRVLDTLIARPAINLQKSRWYLAFAYLKSGDKEACRGVLNQIKSTHYRDKAQQLLKSLK